MNCQYCGKKIGILENWRYGRFCSKEHQEGFREEADRLAASALGSELSSAAAAQNRGGSSLSLTAQPASRAAGESLEPPDPPMMDTVGQVQPTAVRLKPAGPPPIPAAPASERDQRCLKILASIDRMPPVLEKDSRRRLVLKDAPFRFGTVMAKGTRRILVPPSGAVQKRPKLTMADTLLPLRYDETGGPLPDFEPAWQSEAAWDVDSTAPVAMDFGQEFEDYTPDQPWQDWDWDALLEEAKYFQVLAEQREKQRGELRLHKAQDRAAEGSASQQPGRPAYPAMPGRPAPARAPSPTAMPALNPAPPGLTAGQSSPRKPQPAAYCAAAPRAGGPGGMFLPTMPAYPGLTTLQPAAPGSSGAGGRGRSYAAAIPPQAGRSGLVHRDYSRVEWVELAPPPFLALCKIDDPAALSAPMKPAKPVCQTVAVAAEPVPPAEDGTLTIAAARMTLGPRRLFAVEVAPPTEPVPVQVCLPAKPQPAAVSLSIPARRTERQRLALPPRPAHRPIVLDLRPLPAIERPRFAPRIAG